MLSTIKDYAGVFLFLMCAIVFSVAAVFTGLLLMIPVLMYCTYHIFRLYRKAKQLTINYKEEPTNDQK